MGDKGMRVALCGLLFAGLFMLPAAYGGDGQSGSVTILLASESTRFKNSLINELETLFTGEGYKIEKVDHSGDNWNKIKADDYDAVFISNSGVNSRVRPWVQGWLNNNRNSSAYILLHTTQTRDWTVSVDVDSVTSASAMRDVKQLAAVYHRQIVSAITRRAAEQNEQ